MEEKKNFTVIDDKGNQVICEPLFTFESEETGKQYVVYTDNSRDDKGNVKEILKDITFQIMNGDILFLNGDNGCGKSSIINKLINTVLKLNENLALSRKILHMI